MSSLEIQLPEIMREFLDEESVRLGYSCAGDYAREILEQFQRLLEQQRLDNKIDEAMQEPARLMTAQSWALLRQRVVDQAGQPNDP